MRALRAFKTFGLYRRLVWYVFMALQLRALTYAIQDGEVKVFADVLALSMLGPLITKVWLLFFGLKVVEDTGRSLQRRARRKAFDRGMVLGRARRQTG